MTVRAGDSLWSLAERRLGTRDPRPVARLVGRLYAANRQVIGADPDLVVPGQVLRVPHLPDPATDPEGVR